MKRLSLFGTVGIAALMALVMIAPRATASDKKGSMSAKTFQEEHATDMRDQKMGKVFTMSGTLKAAEPQYNTAVVECPVGGQLFTVAGPLAPKVVLKKGGKSAQLSDFKAGEEVKVKWQATEKGHLILMLSEK